MIQLIARCIIHAIRRNGVVCRGGNKGVENSSLSTPFSRCEMGLGVAIFLSLPTPPGDGFHLSWRRRVSGRPNGGPQVSSWPPVRVSGCECCLGRSEEHTSELQYLMRISYAVFCLKKKKKQH